VSKKSQHSSNRVGNITNSTGVAIGTRAHAEVNQQSPIDATQVITMLDDLSRSIDIYAASLQDAATVRKSVEDARREAAKQPARWGTVRHLLQQIQPAVVRISDLATAVSNILALIPHG
jgi:hypothetical protein